MVVKVYFEREGISELVAIYKDEDFYMALLPNLEKLAEESGCSLSESVVEDSIDELE